MYDTVAIAGVRLGTQGYAILFRYLAQLSENHSIEVHIPYFRE